MLPLGYYDITQDDLLTSSVTKLVLLMGLKIINQADIFKSVHH